MCYLCPGTSVTYVSRLNTQAKKVTRSSAGGVEVLPLRQCKIKMESRLRGNDEMKEAAREIRKMIHERTPSPPNPPLEGGLKRSAPVVIRPASTTTHSRRQLSY